MGTPTRKESLLEKRMREFENMLSSMLLSVQKEVKGEVDTSVEVQDEQFDDNEACITIAKHGSVHSGTRHTRVTDAWIYQEVHDNRTIDIDISVMFLGMVLDTEVNQSTLPILHLSHRDLVWFRQTYQKL